MYTTKALSLYKNSPEAMSMPPEGPNSGYLVFQDEESTRTVCCRLNKNPHLRYDLPFPQNRSLFIERSNGPSSSSIRVYMFPIINHPLSSNRYYIIKADGRKTKGKAYIRSKEENVTCCSIQDVMPGTFDAEDIYQQFEFSVTEFCCELELVAKSLANDGMPPSVLRGTGWSVWSRSQRNSTQLGEAQGIDSSLRAYIQDFNFPISQESSKSVAVESGTVLSFSSKKGRKRNKPNTQCSTK